MNWEFLHPQMTEEHLGLIHSFLSEADPRPAKEQLHSNYAHGGGWHPFHGFTFDPTTLTISYPGDPPHRALARTRLRDETILYFDYSWVLILQEDGSWEIARMD